MTNLEQTIEKSYSGKVKNYAGRVRNSVAGRIAVYSLAGALSAGLGYGCGSKEEMPKETCQEGCESAEIISFCETASLSYCNTDDDCVCSFEKQFKGNKEYADKCVEKAYEVTPNFCSGDEFMANPEEGMICVNNVCQWGQKYPCVDNDGDKSYAYDETSCPMSDDCNDNNPAVNHDVGEICDGIDNDCNGETDEKPECKNNCPEEFMPCKKVFNLDCENFSGNYEIIENGCEHLDLKDLKEISFIPSPENKCNVDVISMIKQGLETMTYCEFGGKGIYFVEGNDLTGPLKEKGCYYNDHSDYYFQFRKCGCYIQTAIIEEDIVCQVILKYKTSETMPNKCQPCE